MKIFIAAALGTFSCAYADFDWETQSWKEVDQRHKIEANAAPSERKLIIEGNKTPFSKDGKYHRVRVPVATVSKSGVIIVASEGRLGANPEHPPGTDRDWDHLLVSRSEDFGKTWTTEVIEKGEGKLDLGALSICADKKSDKGVFILAYCANKSGKVMIFNSKDDGKSWTKHRQSGEVFKGGSKNREVRMRPTHGIQLSSLHGEGGDMLVPGVIGYEKNRMMGMLSYDLGEDRWSLKEVLEGVPHAEKAGEMTLAELDGEQAGSIFFLTRPETKEVGKKKSQLVYTPGGEPASAEGWTDSAFTFKRCNQNLAKYSFKEFHKKSRMVFSSTKNLKGKRLGGHVSVSYSGGKTWKSKAIVPDEEQFGYSQIVVLPDGSLGVIYEGQNREGAATTALYFKRATLGWLTDGKDKGLMK